MCFGTAKGSSCEEYKFMLSLIAALRAVVEMICLGRQGIDVSDLRCISTEFASSSHLSHPTCFSLFYNIAA